MLPGNYIATDSTFLVSRCCILAKGPANTYFISQVKAPITAELPNKGHFGANGFVLCREVVPISEGPLSEVPL